MKKILYTGIALAIATSAFAQNDKDSLVSNEKFSKFGYYKMQEDYLIYFHADGIADTMIANISLRNGKTLSSIGELFEKDGSKVFLKEGQCVNANGSIEDCDKLKQKMLKKMDKKNKPVLFLVNPFF